MFDSKWIYKIEDRGNNDIISEILKIRGIEDSDDFIKPDLKKLYDPFLMNDMDKAVKRIVEAINNNEKIYVYGDYDADGLTSAAILVRFFKSLGLNTNCFIPDRFDDGYGLSIESFQNIVEKDVQLVITTDCGINSVQEVEFLKQNGIDTIITDHHKSMGVLPDAEAVICCTRTDNTYPYKNLSGAGVAFKLTEAISNFLKIEKKDKNLLVLAALGTVADIVKLDGENRIIVSSGLKMIQSGLNMGIDAILNISAVKRENTDTYTLGFVVGPHINAAGRMGKANLALELLLCDDIARAEKLANDLTLLNNKRKNIQDKIFEKILEQLVNNPSISNMPVIVAGGENYNKGVIGIVASKISGIYKKPTIIYSIKNGVAVGSGRSNGDFSLIESLVYCDEILDKYGGHKNGAGLSLNAEKIEVFREKLAEFAYKNNFTNSSDNSLLVDCDISTNELNFEFVDNLLSLEPFGFGNPKPIFSLKNAELSEYRRIGANGKHLSFTFKKNGLFTKAVCFNSSEYEPLLFLGEKYNLAFNADINNFKGQKSMQLMLKDITLSISDKKSINIMIVRLLAHMIKYKKSIIAGRDIKLLSGELFKLGMPTAAEELLINTSNYKINREDVSVVFTKVKQFKCNQVIDIRDISNEIGIEKLALGIEVLIELGILKFAPTGMYTYMVYEDFSRQKKNLVNSAVYRVFSEKEG